MLLCFIIWCFGNLSTVCLLPHDGRSPRAILYPVKSNNIENNALKTKNVQGLDTP